MKVISRVLRSSCWTKVMVWSVSLSIGCFISLFLVHGCGTADPAVSSMEKRIDVLEKAATQPLLGEQTDVRMAIKEIEECYQQRYADLREFLVYGLTAFGIVFTVVSVLATFITWGSNKELRVIYEKLRKFEGDLKKTQTQLDNNVANVKSQSLLEVARLYIQLAAAVVERKETSVVLYFQAMDILFSVHQKNALSRLLLCVQFIRRLSPPSRFLHNTVQGMYHTMSEEDAVDRFIRSLQEKTNSVSDENIQWLMSQLRMSSSTEAS